jgi:hypothetical protein
MILFVFVAGNSLPHTSRFRDKDRDKVEEKEKEKAFAISRVREMRVRFVVEEVERGLEG